MTTFLGKIAEPWSLKPDLNWRLTPYHGVTLPTELLRHKNARRDRANPFS